MNRYYTDIDFVLHYYTTPFFKMAQQLYNIKIDEDSVSEEKTRSVEYMKDCLSYFSEINGLSKEQIEECVRATNVCDNWVPTSFGKDLGAFLGDKAREGHEVIAITARSIRGASVKKIIRKSIGVDVPIINCDTEHKHLIINDHDCEKAIYFEDHYIPAINVSKKFKKNSIVFVPDWPWNRKEIKEAYKETNNLILIEPKKLIDLITKKTGAIEQ